MDELPIKIFLIEDDPGDVDLIKELLTPETNPSFSLQSVNRLQTAIKQFTQLDADIILLDLSLPDSQGLKTFQEVHRQEPNIPIVVLTGLNDETVALESVRQGAQDYLVKGQINGKMLSRPSSRISPLTQFFALSPKTC